MKPWLIVLLIAIVPVAAHEFWLQPVSYTGQVGNEIAVDWRIGSSFVGTPYVYLPNMAQQMAQVNQNTRQEITPRFAAKPALNVTLGEQTTIVLTESTDFEIRYDDTAEFTSFLTKEHLLTMVDVSELPANGEIVESYARFAKALLTSDDKPWQDQTVGLDYEWVITAAGEQLMGQLRYLGEPAVNHPVKLFEQVDASNVQARTATTNGEGRVLFNAMTPGHVYLLNAIRIEPITPTSNEFNASWHSDWASTTFQWR